MPANLPPQFFQLQAKLNSTKDVKEKIEILKQMLAICPKHKGTERVQEDLKRKIAKLKKIKPKKVKREDLYFVEKEGVAQIVVLGPPNSGKTSLVNLVSKVSFKVADYPFTTQFPKSAMFKFGNLSFQLVDCPPITKEYKPGWLKNLAKQADKILLVLSVLDNPKEKLKEMFEILNEWQIEKEKVLIVGTKVDLLKEKNLTLENEISFIPFSSKNLQTAENLKKIIFDSLKIVRVYLKEPKKEVDFENPIIAKKGIKLIDFLKEINKEWANKFKGAKLYTLDLKKFQLVGKEYQLKDGDIIELKF
ncbi:50S ribosome-binding GTPase [Candidatus Parcubacteria bacterium]|nr:50S ribosome-binding GTPase [Candidatus Parcubacteria bacterium]